MKGKRRIADIHRGRPAQRGFGLAVARVRRVDGVPVDLRQDMARIVEFPPVLAVAVEHPGQEDVAVAERLAPADRHAARPGGAGNHVAAQAGQPLGLQPALDVRHRLADVGVAAEDAAGVEGVAAGAPRVRLAHDAADQLGDGAPGGGVVEHGQHVGEGAVPTLHQRGAGDDPAHRRAGREEIDAGELVALRGLHRDGALGRVEAAN